MVQKWPLNDPVSFLADLGLVKRLVVYRTVGKVNTIASDFNGLAYSDPWHELANFRAFTSLEEIIFLNHPDHWDHPYDVINWRACFQDLWDRFINPRRVAAGLGRNPIPNIQHFNTSNTDMFGDAQRWGEVSEDEVSERAVNEGDVSQGEVSEGEWSEADVSDEEYLRREMEQWRSSR